MPAPESPFSCVITPVSWSPASGDPRFSRTAPDALLARVLARGPRAPGNYVDQLAHAFAAYLRKHPTTSPSRKKTKNRFALFAPADHVDPRRPKGICTGSRALPLPAPVARQECQLR